jgi:hypothetical protein
MLTRKKKTQFQNYKNLIKIYLTFIFQHMTFLIISSMFDKKNLQFKKKMVKNAD